VGQADLMRFLKWPILTFAVIGGLGAAFAFIVYVANGMVVGDLIGLPGREHDIAVAHHRSSIGLLSCVLLQFGVAGALFRYTGRKNDSRVVRILWAVFVSFVVTLVCGIAILLGMRAFR
jgi:hypothetical protein